MESASQASTPRSKGKQPEQVAIETEHDAEDLAQRFFTLRRKARRLRREAQESEREASDLLKDHPFLGNLLGITNKEGKKSAPPRAEAEKQGTSAEGSKQKKRRREAAVLPGKTMSEKDIAREGGEVPARKTGQKGRLEAMEIEEVRRFG